MEVTEINQCQFWITDNWKDRYHCQRARGHGGNHSIFPGRTVKSSDWRDGDDPKDENEWIEALRESEDRAIEKRRSA